MKKPYYRFAIYFILFCGVTERLTMAALPPTQIQLATPFLKDGPTYERFKTLNDRLKKEGKAKGFPYSNDPKDPYNPDGMRYENFFEDEKFTPTYDQWEQCAKIPPEVSTPYGYYPFSAHTCAIVVKTPDANNANQYTYALEDIEGNILVSSAMKKATHPCMHQKDSPIPSTLNDLPIPPNLNSGGHQYISDLVVLGILKNSWGKTVFK